jgi:uncharacterized protein with FMN-binding domain
MPIVVILIAVAVIFGIGSYFLRPEDVSSPTTTDLPADIANSDTTDTDGTTVPLSEDPVDVTQTNVPPSEDPADSAVTSTQKDTTSNGSGSTATSQSTFADGSHQGSVTYSVPGNHTTNLNITLTLQGDTVTASEVVFSGNRDHESIGYENRFTKSYQSQVVGKKLSEIKLSRVSGASLTTNAFNSAVAKVQSTAKN